MESYLISSHFDLTTPDGFIVDLKKISETQSKAIIKIENISEAFLGFQISKDKLIFNIKSTLAQLGVDSVDRDFDLNKKTSSAEVSIDLVSRSKLGETLLNLLSQGDFVGKIFAKEETRKVREPNYLARMFSRKDRNGRPLLSFGTHQKEDLFLEKKNGFTLAFIPVKKGRISYNKQIINYLYILDKILSNKDYPTRNILKLFQKFNSNQSTINQKNDLLLIKTDPLYIRTAFAKVNEDYLPKGLFHTSANILEPNTFASGDIYEFYGESQEEITNIPLEFYTLEPHREYVFFEDRDQLQEKLENPKALFDAINTAPKPNDNLASVFIVKGTQLDNLKEKDWITKDPKKSKFPGIEEPKLQSKLVKKYILQQPSYPFLKAIEDGLITSEGILLTRHFPSPLLKKMLLSDLIQEKVKGIYFQYPSKSNDEFFSHEDRAFLIDLSKFAIPVYWIDKSTNSILQYTLKPHKEAGMFVPIHLTQTFKKATFFGIYGSNLIEGSFDVELEKLLKMVLDLREHVSHPLLSKNTPLALVTGGGPGAMEVGNKVARKLNILSCANIANFSSKGSVVNEQKINPHIDAKMTYRLDRLVERQAEFYLDFPIFLMGGIGTDFEYSLEEVKRKTGSSPPNPILLFGKANYWKEKITHRFHINLKTKTIEGSAWISNCFYCVQTAEDGLKVYKDFFDGTLPIGKNGPIYKDGFCESYK